MIDRNGIYPVKEFLEECRLKPAGLRTAIRNGLRVVYAHGTRWVSGEDWHEYLKTRDAQKPRFDNLEKFNADRRRRRAREIAGPATEDLV